VIYKNKKILENLNIRFIKMIYKKSIKIELLFNVFVLD